MSVETKPIENPLANHPVASHEQWLTARLALLAEEKEHIRNHDRIAAARRDLPWVKIDKPYVFEDPDGLVGLADLFDGRSQLLVYHFMFAQDWDEGCTGCSFWSDHVDAARQHFEHNDLSFAAVSRAPIDKLEKYRERMGWTFRWVSSKDSDFNFDFHVSANSEEVAANKMYYNFTVSDGAEEELPGISVFYKDESGQIFHTYSGYSRSGEAQLGAYTFLDLAPKGRNEETNLMDWVKRHDCYEDGNSG
jgi:predicted dithiol-disulfide oxidoreductase (DUF899 family)